MNINPIYIIVAAAIAASVSTVIGLITLWENRKTPEPTDKNIQNSEPPAVTTGQSSIKVSWTSYPIAR